MRSHAPLAEGVRESVDYQEGHGPEVGTVSQRKTIEEAIANLKEATELYLEEFPLPIVAVFEAAVQGKGSTTIRKRITKTRKGENAKSE